MRRMIHTLKKLIFSVTALTLIAACSLSDENDMWPVVQNLSQPSPMLATLSVSTEVASSSARTVLPSDDVTDRFFDLTFDYKATNNSDISGSITADSLSELNEKLSKTTFSVSTYSFALTASLDGNAKYVGSVTSTLKTGTNAIHFDLTEQNGNSYGGFNLTLGYTGKAAKVSADLYSFQYGMIASNEELSFTESASGGTVTYAKDVVNESERLNTGLYEVSISFYADEARNLLLNTYSEYILVAAGRTSTATRSLTLNDVYTITYYDVAEDGTTSVISRDSALFAGADVPVQFTRKVNCALPQSLTKQNCRFRGWYTDKACTAGNEISEIAQGTSKNIAVYAKWSYLKYTVTFMGRDGVTPLNTQMVGEGEKPEWFSFDEIDGEYRFNDWYKDSACSEWIYIWETKIHADTTVYSRWYVYSTVTYYKNDGSGESNTETNHEKDAEFSLSPYEYLFSPRTDGYYFLGWATSANASEPEYYSGDTYGVLTEPVSFYAVWSQETYTVTLINSYDTSQKEEKKVAKNSKILRYYLYDGSFTGPERYHQDGWSTSTSIDDYINNWWDAVEITGDVTYYALWRINVDCHGGWYYDETETDEYHYIVSFFYGEPITYSAEKFGTPSRAHYTFTQWYTDRDCTKLAVFPLSTSDAVMDEYGTYWFHVYAKWEASAQTAITVELQSVQADAAINLTLSGNTFSAANGFASYLWRIDGAKVTDATTNTYTVDTSALEAGVHNVTLAVRSSDGMRYSATAVIKVQKE